MQAHFSWKRYWARREGKITLGDGGYLVDPEDKYGRLLNPDLVELTDLDATPCVVLLGEAGIGKSTAVADDCDRLRRSASESGATFIHVDLREFGSEDRLVRTLFEGPDFIAWRNGSFHLHLYLDSLDECSLQIASVAALLVAQLAKVPHARLWLRVACRTAVWPRLLEDALRNWYRDEGLQVRELAPLRRVDVELAANALGTSGSAFLEAVTGSNAVPLAIKPITLEFLLHLFAEEGRLPSRQVELYEKGCQKLCEEVNLARRASAQIGRLSASARLEVASWVAFFTIFSGKGTVQTEPCAEVLPHDVVDLGELVALEGAPNIHDIREVFAISGLFTSRGSLRLGWAHKTYAEFLAARFAAKLPYAQVRALVLHHHDDGTVVPQLRETAAWLASLTTDAFHDIATRDPQVLLSSDVADLSPSARAQLVNQLLETFDRHAALDDNWDDRRLYSKLQHADIAKQLAPYIADKSKNVIVRRVAIDIAEACLLRELQELLLGVALDSSDLEEPRVQAAYAVARIGDPDTVVQLRSLLGSDAVTDSGDQLRGIALRVLYPDHIAIGEVFAALRSPKRTLFHGAYESFIYHLAGTLPPAALPEALSWALATAIPDRHGAIARLQDAVLSAAWEHTGEPAVLRGLVALVGRCLASHESPFGDSESSSHPAADARRLVAAGLLVHAPFQKHLRTYGVGPIVCQEDLSWLMDEFECDPEGQTAAPIARLIARMVWHEIDGNVALLDRAIALGQSHRVLGDLMAGLLAPIMLGSQEAEELRKSHEEWQQTLREPKALREVPDLAERIQRAIDLCERELDWACWWELTRYLQLTEQGAHTDEFDAGVGTFPGWVRASESLRERIVVVAEHYLVECDPDNDQWFGTSELFYSALAGYRALELLRHVYPKRFSALAESVWSKWLPIVISYPNGPSKEIVKAAAAVAEDRILELASTLLDRQAEGHRRVEAVRALEYCWSERVAAFVLQKAKQTSHPGIADVLIEQGLEQHDERFTRLAETVVSALAQVGDEEASKRRIALLALLARYALRESWEFLWHLMRSDRSTARDVWLAVASRTREDAKKAVASLSCQSAADLYIWLRREFPVRRGRSRRGSVSPDDAIVDFRDAVIGSLQTRGEWESLSALDRVIAEFPEDEFARFRRVLARRSAAQTTWSAPSTRDLAALVAAAERRMVESAGQLLEVVLESFARYQAELHGELGAVRDLWDKCTKEDWQPVDEGDLSDRIARHLRADLGGQRIIVNREVQIRKGRPGLKGQRTDIYIDAFAGESPIRLVIEVKGCWHPDVNTAMETQLRDRYLKDNACTHGVYVVGYFLDEGWSDADRRKGDSQRLLPPPLRVARASLADQATTLSSSGKTLRAFVLDARLGGPSD